MKTCIFFWQHDWGKWHTNTIPTTYTYRGKILSTVNQLYQRRMCKKCGKIQEIEL